MRILLLRSAGAQAPLPELGGDVDVLLTHEIAPSAEGLVVAREACVRATRLIVTSATAARILTRGGAGSVLGRSYREVLAAGPGTAETLVDAGVSAPMTPERPGAAGILAALPDVLEGERILWPRGSDADGTLAQALEARGARVDAPVIYVKSPVAIPRDTLLSLRQGRWGAVAVGSLAALEVLLDALRRDGAGAPPSLAWGTLGPETARAFARRGLPDPLVPAIPRIPDLIAALRAALAAPAARG